MTSVHTRPTLSQSLRSHKCNMMITSSKNGDNNEKLRQVKMIRRDNLTGTQTSNRWNRKNSAMQPTMRKNWTEWNFRASTANSMTTSLTNRKTTILILISSLLVQQNSQVRRSLRRNPTPLKQITLSSICLMILRWRILDRNRVSRITRWDKIKHQLNSHKIMIQIYSLISDSIQYRRKRKRQLMIWILILLSRRRLSSQSKVASSPILLLVHLPNSSQCLPFSPRRKRQTSQSKTSRQ